MKYVRLTKKLNDFGKLVPESEVYDNITDPNLDWYKSVYYYNEEHFKIFKDTGSVAGISDVFTDNIIFDFDSEQNLTQAKNDTIELVSRLITHGIKQDMITICFSGNKGFSVELKTTENLTPKQHKNLCKHLSTGLVTFDTKVYNSNRIFRIPLTKHNESGLYKLPINLNQLIELDPNDIKDLAKSTSNATEWVEHIVELPQSIKDMVDKEFNDNTPSTINTDELDLSKKPKWLSACKYAIMEGFFKGGSRNNALMALGATIKAQGLHQAIAYRMLKGAAELQAQRTGQERFPDEEIHKNIIEVIYSPTWQGATYSCKDHEFLQEVCPVKNTNRCHVHKKEGVVHISDVSDVFASYAKDIDNNTIKTGIESLDKSMRMLAGTHVILAGTAGSGKCLGKGTEVLMFDGSIKKVEDIKVGEFIMGDDSTPRKIISTCKGIEPLFRVEQDNGNSYVVNESHILSLKSCNTFSKGKYETGKVYDISVKDYLNKGKDFKRYLKGYRNPIEFSSKDLPIDPYVLGYWLGNGTRVKPQISLNSNDLEIINYFQKWTNSNQYMFKIKQNSENGCSIDFFGNSNDFIKNLKKLNIYDNKHIPDIYTISSSKQRMGLLAGLLDSDGYYDKNKNTYEFSSSDERLMIQFQRLCRSLGFYCSYSKENKKYNSFTRGKWYRGTSVSYRAYVTGDNLHKIPNILSRKKAKIQTKQRYSDVSKINLVNLGLGEYYGFEIDGNRRFVLASDYTVTHNTTLALNIMQNTSENGLISLFGSADMGTQLVYQKIAQKVTGYSEDKIFKIYKDNLPERKKVDELISKSYKNVKFDFRRGPTIEELRSTILDLKAQEPERFKLMIFDYIGKITGPYTDDTANMAYIAPRLADIADEAGVCLISLAQVARSKGGPNTPFTDHRVAKGSGAIEESATIVMGVWRPGYNTDNDNFMTVAGLKMRMGKEFKVDLGFNGASSTIYELSDEQVEELEVIRARDKEEKSKSGW